VLERVNDIIYILQTVSPKKRKIISHVDKLCLLPRDGEKSLMMAIKTGLCLWVGREIQFSHGLHPCPMPAANALTFHAIRSVQSCILLVVILNRIQFSQLIVVTCISFFLSFSFPSNCFKV
jgi:fucose permease